MIIFNFYSRNSKQEFYNTQPIQSKGNSKVFGRLTNARKNPKPHESNPKTQHKDKECTFQPKINHNSKKWADQLARNIPLELRNSIDVNKYHTKKADKYYESHHPSSTMKSSKASFGAFKCGSLEQDYTFKPTVSDASRNIAESKQKLTNQPQNVFQRLISNREIPMSTFKNFNPLSPSSYSNGKNL